jgi:hypothetical protein
MGSDWCTESLMLAKRVNEKWSTWKGEVRPIHMGCSEINLLWLVRPPTVEEWGGREMKINRKENYNVKMVDEREKKGSEI